MALKYADRVKETTTTTGTGTVNLAGAATGYQTFVSGVGTGNTCTYVIEDADGSAWEVGIGTVTDATPDTLSRSTIIASSNAGSAITLSSGTHTVYLSATSVLAQSAYESHSAVMPGGRLSLATADPIPNSDQGNKQTLYYTPYLHDRISLWTGDYWKTIQFSEDSLALSGLSTTTVYDIYCFLNSGAFDMEAVAWTNATTRNSASGTYPTVQDGRLCKHNNKDRLYLGTIYMDGSTYCQDTLTQRFLWNQYNRVPRRLYRLGDTTSASLTVAAGLVKWSGDSSAKLEVCVGGLAGGGSNEAVELRAQCIYYPYQSAGGSGAYFGWGYDTQSAFSSGSYTSYGFYHSNPYSVYQQMSAFMSHQPAIGLHYYSLNNQAINNTVTIHGNDGDKDGSMSGLFWA